jgi:hypothetical protein
LKGSEMIGVEIYIKMEDFDLYRCIQ